MTILLDGRLHAFISDSDILKDLFGVCWSQNSYAGFQEIFENIFPLERTFKIHRTFMAVLKQ